MSTRSAITRPTDTGFQGLYHHSDGYPSGLGAFLFEACREQFAGDASKLAEALLDVHRGGWSFVVGTDLTSGQTGGWDDIGNPDMDYSLPRCYCHRAGESGEDATGTERDFDPCGIEWVYEIWPSYLIVRKGNSAESDAWEAAVKHNLSIDVDRYFPVVARVRWTDAEPDWEVIQKDGDTLLESSVVARTIDTGSYVHWLTPDANFESQTTYCNRRPSRSNEFHFPDSITRSSGRDPRTVVTCPGCLAKAPAA